MIQTDNATVYVGSNLDILPTLPDNSVDAIVTDPPYGLSDNKFVAETVTRWIQGERDFIPDGKGFMGKAWDAFVPPPALWDECLRVLKPGGHLLAFFGSRTQDIGALSIRLAGFEIRDSVAWMYGSGFPKSLDISKAIDKKRDDSAESVKVAIYLLKHNKLQTISEFRAFLNREIVGTNHSGGSAQEWTTTKLAGQVIPRVPTIEQWGKLKKLLNLDDSMDSEVWRLNGLKGEPGEAWSQREVIGQKPSSLGGTVAAGERNQEIIDHHKNKIVDITAPATPEAQQWEGWGTALKPAFEPIVVARKPLIGTVAENVLTYGTGGLNIDGSRIAADMSEFYSGTGKPRSGKGHLRSYGAEGEFGGDAANLPSTLGGWPANVILDPYTAELLDEQSGVSISKSGGMSGTHPGPMDWGKENKEIPRGGFDDKGGASRFFYVAKASKRDRNEGLEELNTHPTVKPTDLMRYLVKLVTPPGGTVLDPFTGSGSTGKAAILEGFKFIGCELTEDYHPIIEGRLRHAEQMRKEQEAKKDEGLF